MATCNPATLVASAAAFSGLDDRQMRLAIIQLLCDVSGGSSEGGSGNSILGGSGSPVGSAGASGPAIYIQDNGVIWVLPVNGTSADWVIAMAPPPPMAAPVPAESWDFAQFANAEELGVVRNRVQEALDSIRNKDAEIESAQSSIGSLHDSVLSMQQALESKTKETEKLASTVAVMAKSSDTLLDSQRALLDEVSDLKKELSRTIRQEQFDRIMVEIDGLKTVPVILPAKKPSLFSKLRDWSTNLFA